MYKTLLVGTGGIARQHVKSVNSLSDRVQLVAAMDIDGEKLAAFCKTYNIPRHYTDLDTALAEEAPDFVIIASPPYVHAEQIIKSMEAGSCVLCEKPMVASLAEFDAITKAEERTGRYAASVFQQRFGAGAVHLKKLTESGELGRPLVVVCQTTWYRGQDYYDVPWRGKWDTEVGGTTVIHGIHTIDMTLDILGPWREIRAVKGTLDRDIEVDDVMMAIVTLESGAMMSIINSALSPRQETRVRIDYQRVTAEVDYLYAHQSKDWRYTLPDGSPDTELLAAWSHIRDNPMPVWDMQLSAFLDALDKGERPPISGDDVRPTIEFIAALYKAGLTGQTVKRGEIGPGDPFYTAMSGVSAKPKEV